MKKTLKYVTLVSLFIVLAVTAVAKRPNIVLFYLDDWAWNGSPVMMDDSAP